MQQFDSAPPSEFSFSNAASTPASNPSHRAWETAKARAVDEFRKSPYQLREQVCLCTDVTLTTFAKLLFCRLTDMAFKESFRRGDGVLDCSKKFLADDFGCCTDTVTRATRDLEKTGFIWTKTIWHGGFELTRWFIREWADDSKEYGAHSGSNFGRKLGTGVNRNANRDEHGKFVGNPDSTRAKFRKWLASQEGSLGGGQGSPGGVQGGDPAANGADGTPHISQESTVKAKIRRVHGQESAGSGLTSQPGQGGLVHRDHRQESALTGLTSQPGHGARISPDRADPSALTRRKNQPGHGGGMSGLNTLRDGYYEVDHSKRLSNRSKAPARNRRRLDPATQEFMARCREVLGMEEMRRNGGLWLTNYRTDKARALAVINDTAEAVKTRRVKTTAAACAVDFWKRLSADHDKASAQPKPKPKPKPAVITMQPEPAEPALEGEERKRALESLREAAK